MKVLIADFDLFSAMGGGQTFYRSLNTAGFNTPTSHIYQTTNASQVETVTLTIANTLITSTIPVSVQGTITTSLGVVLPTSYSVAPPTGQLGNQISNVLSPFSIASFTTATPTNITSAGILLTSGVWSINVTLELLVTVAIATVQVQTLYNSVNSAGAYSTRLLCAGCTRIHTVNTFAINDTPALSGSFIYSTTGSIIIYPIFQITYTAGPTISGTGYYTATRIA